MHLTHHAKIRLEQPDRPVSSPTDVKEVMRYGRKYPARDGATKHIWFNSVVIEKEGTVITTYRNRSRLV